MNRFVLILVAFVSFTACNKNSRLDKANANMANNIYIDHTLVEELQPVLKDWLVFYALDLSKFTPTDTLTVDWNELKKNTFIYFKKFRPEDEKYMPGVRCYSPDRKRFVDLIESTQDTSDDIALSTDRWKLESPHIEQRIYLYNRIDSTSMLLAMKNKVNMIENTKWIDNDRFVLAGVDKSEENAMYYFAMYRIHEKDIQVFCLPDSTIPYQKKNFLKDIVLPNRGK